jgi:bisphosphoglycerate-independent phosphoglycerate mutase (AlkP superfamily)
MPNDVTDEFVVPAVLGDYAGVEDGDVLLFANFPRRPGAGDFVCLAGQRL